MIIMNTKKIMTMFTAAALTLGVSAQQNAHENFVGVDFGGGLNTMLYKAENGKTKVGAGFDAGLFYSHFFNEKFGLGVGLRYSYANASAVYNYDEVTTGLVHADNPNLYYDLTTSYNDWKERQNMGLLSIPVELLYRKPINDSWAFIGGLGLSLDMPVHGKYKAKDGSYSTSGVFPDLGTHVFSDMPEHGFSTYDAAFDAKIDNRIKVGCSALIDLGMRKSLGDNWGIYFGAYAGFGLTNILAEEKTNPLLLINETDPSRIDYAGTFDSNETSKVHLLRAGIKVAIDFGWSKKKDSDSDGVFDKFDLCPDTPAEAAATVDENGCPKDSDGDGVLDYLDKCSDTPAGVKVDANGCPVDTDGDGIADYLDKCSGTPKGVKVDTNGCPVDSDGDGIADYLDKCSGTPAGVKVDANGCPVDSDGDGVADYLDNCPHTPGTVANNGCPEVKEEAKREFQKAMEGIKFQTGKDIITKDSYPILDNIADILKANPEYTVAINGYTDNVGNDEKNLVLSEKRAAAVRNYLINKGVESERMTSKGFGEANPRADNSTAAGRAQNRRVEFIVNIVETYFK